MSFGFGISDVVGFTKFAAKVWQSLKDECGAKPEYQAAALQCKNFVETMDIIKALDLSRLPESLRERIENGSAHVHEFVEAFKERISKYEKAMGKSTKQGWIDSAPRKIQWAFDAADDLAKFRESLLPLINLVQVVMTAGVFELLSKSTQPLPMPYIPTVSSSALALQTPTAPLVQSFIGPRHDVFEYKWSLASEVAAFVYDRLMSGYEASFVDNTKASTPKASPDGIPNITPYTFQHSVSSSTIENGTTVFNKECSGLGNGCVSSRLGIHEGYYYAHPEANTGSDEQSLVPYGLRMTRPDDLRDLDRDESRGGMEDEIGFTYEINEYLHSLDLEELTETEKAHLNRTAFPSSQLRANYWPNRAIAASSETVEIPAPTVPMYNTQRRNGAESAQGVDDRSPGGIPSPGWTFRISSLGFDPVGGSVAVAGVYSFATQLSLSLKWLSKSFSGDEELNSTRREIIHFGTLVRVVGDMMRASIYSDSSHHRETWRATKEIIELGRAILTSMDKIVTKISRKSRRLLILTMPRKLRALKKLKEELANIRSQMNIFFQMHQMQLADGMQHNLSSLGRAIFEMRQDWMLSNMQSAQTDNKQVARSNRMETACDYGAMSRVDGLVSLKEQR